MNRLMSDAEIRRRKKVQGRVSEVTGGLGLVALGGTLAASRGGRNMLRKVPKLESKIKAPPARDPHRDRIKGAVTPVLATSAGLGGASSFNFAAYTRAESRKKKAMTPAPIKKQFEPMEMGYFGEEGRPVKLPKIEVPIEKAWEPVASNYDSERSRHRRSKVYESGALVTAGGAGAYTAHQGRKAVKTIRATKPAADTTLDALRPAFRRGGKTIAGAAAVGAAVGANTAIKHKRKSSWESYGKRDSVSAFGVDHTE